LARVRRKGRKLANRDDVLEKLLNRKIATEADYPKNLGKYAYNNATAIGLHRMANSRNLQTIKENADPELGAMVQGEDFGIPETSDAQIVPFQIIMQEHPGISIEDALKLSGEYIYPQRAKEFGTPIDYLKAHEGSHFIDKLSTLSLAGGNPSEGVGNYGYMQTRKVKDYNIPENTAQIEDWLAKNYSPKQRPEERKAHLMGLEALKLKLSQRKAQ
jgi:hypothetical protein